ncbi:MAG: ABC transporter permease [Patescibacteria group bacterium]|nr:ABC transporter permease [Patescibacteria group bacterium]
MNFQELVALSWKSITVNKLRSFLTTLGIIIGVFSIILLVSIGSGIQGYVTNEISSLGSNLIDVLPGNTSGGGFGSFISNKLRVQDWKSLDRKLTPIAKLTPVIRQVATIKYKTIQDKGAFVAGVSYQYPFVVTSTKMSQGIFFTKGQEQAGTNVAVIGNTVYEKFFPGQNAIGKRIYIGSKLYTIIGVAEKRGSFLGVDQDNIAYISVESAQELFGSNILTEIAITADSPELVPIVIDQTKQVLLKRLTADDFSVETADTLTATISNITNMLSLALGGIAAISLLVGGIGVANIMLVSVTERTREIGLRKALGAKRSDILKQFLIEAVMISVLGGVIGIILGMGASIIVAKLLVSEVTPWSVVIAFVFSVAIGIIFGMAPAIRASKLSPIEALRYE